MKILPAIIAEIHVTHVKNIEKVSKVKTDENIFSENFNGLMKSISGISSDSCLEILQKTILKK